MDQRVLLGRAAGAAKRAAKKAARDAGTAPLPRAAARRRAQGEDGGSSPVDDPRFRSEPGPGETEPPDS